MPQTTFTQDPGPGQAGEIASSADFQLNSAIVDEAGGVAAGLFVSRAADPTQASLPGLATDVTDAGTARGFAFLDSSKESPVTYADALPMTYLEKGEIFAVVDVQSVAVVAGDPVYVRFDTAISAGTVGAVASTAVDADFALLGNAQAVSATLTDPDGNPIVAVKFHR